MSEQMRGKHGPAEDERIKRQDLTDLQEQADEWPGPASPDDPQAIWAEGGRFAGTQPGEDWQGIELRSGLARQLHRADFPITRARLLEILDASLADQRLVDLASAVPDGARYNNLAELLRALGLPVEH